MGGVFSGKVGIIPRCCLGCCSSLRSLPSVIRIGNYLLPKIGPALNDVQPLTLDDPLGKTDVKLRDFLRGLTGPGGKRRLQR